MTEKKIPYGVRFSILNRAFRRQMDDRFRSKGLTGPQVCVMGELHRLEKKDGEEIHQKDLEAAVGLTHPTMNDILCRLEKKGFIVREPSKKDRRAKVIRSTGLAAQLHAEVPAMDEAVFATLTQGLTETELAEFLRVMDVILLNAKRYKEGKEEAADD